MKPESYVDLKKRSCITTPDIWCGVVKITKDQDKAYSSGRTLIPKEVAERIRALVVNLSEHGAALAKAIEMALPHCTVKFDDSTCAITLTFPSSKTVQIECAGVDATNFAPVYVAARSSKNEAIFLYFGEKSALKPKSIKGDQWFLWRGNFPENRSLHCYQNYFNEIKGEILTSAFNFYA